MRGACNQTQHRARRCYTSEMHQFTEGGVDLDRLRERLRRMTDKELSTYGQAAKYMCSPHVSLKRPPRKAFLIQLKEAAAEWRRRHPR
jgi:hypothetical protein